MLCESPQRPSSPVMLGSAIQERSYLSDCFWCFRSCRAACFLHLYSCLFQSLQQGPAHRQLSSGWDRGFVFKSRAPRHNFPLRALCCSTRETSEPRLSPLPQKLHPDCWDKVLEELLESYLKQRIVSLENGTPLGAFFNNYCS